MESGIKADVLVCRTEYDYPMSKHPLFAMLVEAVIQSLDVETI